MSPDFTNIVFALREWKCREEMGIPIGFPIAEYAPVPSEDVATGTSPSATPFFARISLETKDRVEAVDVPRELHPRAGRVLVVLGSSVAPFGTSRLGPLLEVDVTPFPGLEPLRERLSVGRYDIVHVSAPVIGADIFAFNAGLFHQGHFVDTGPDIHVDTGSFIDAVDRARVKLLFLSSCNSLQVFSRVRASSLRALVAATENLAVDYALAFESSFYHSLSVGSDVSEAFRSAAASLEARGGMITRSGSYDPMFLDLKEDFGFGGALEAAGARAP